MIIELIKGEKRSIPLAVRRRKKIDYTIENVNCSVYDNNNNEIESGIGIINDVDKEVYYFLDTGNDHFIHGKNYTIIFTVSIKGIPNLLKSKRIVKIRKEG